MTLNKTYDNVVEACVGFAEANHNVDVLWLYGSRANGTSSEHSDYDFAVAFNTFPQDEWDIRLQPELLADEWAQALPLSREKISVVDINHVPLPLAYAVVSTGAVLIANDSLRMVREENRITSMWDIDYLYHRQHYG